MDERWLLATRGYSDDWSFVPAVLRDHMKALMTPEERTACIRMAHALRNYDELVKGAQFVALRAALGLGQFASEEQAAYYVRIAFDLGCLTAQEYEIYATLADDWDGSGEELIAACKLLSAECATTT